MARITRLKIEGYRSIGERVEVAFPEYAPVVLVGENNAGKSNIIRALQLVLGPFWPGNHDPEDHEFFGRDRNRRMEITVEFSPSDPLGGRFVALVWRYEPSADDPIYFRGITADGEEKYVRNDDRDSCVCVVVEADRNLSYQLSYSSKWTLLSRVMHRFHRALVLQAGVKTDLEALFGQVKDKFHQVPEFATFVADLSEQLRDLVGSMTHRLEVDFEAYNPINFFHALRLQATEGDEPRVLEEMGTGEQQVLALALAHAYARAFHGGLVLVVEEPEAHLHPLAQEWLAARLRAQCSEGLQLAVTTHSPAFVHVEGLDGLALVHKMGGQTKVRQLTRRELAAFCVQRGAPAKRTTADTVLPFYSANASQELLSGFFARVVVLVEGPTEAHALPVYLQRCGLQTSKEGLAFLPVGGKGNLGKWRRLYEAYGIPCYTVFDNDLEDDREGHKRRDALRALGLPEEQMEGVLSGTDWVVEEEFAVFGRDFESAMKEHFRGYTELEMKARQQGIENKPFVARWVAEQLQRSDTDRGWRKLERMIEILRAKMPKFGAFDSADGRMTARGSTAHKSGGANGQDIP
jgi:putative ATP-dependent endonuclease of OLD family